MMRFNSIKHQQRGFTILELMIATTVLAVMLVLVSAMMIAIGNLYYKGVSQARIQADTRSIVDDLAQHLQLSDVPPRTEAHTLTIPGDSTHVIKAYCTDSTRYSYVLDKQIGTNSDQIRHVLWRDSIPSTGCDPADLTSANPSSGGTELISGNSRLTAFSISPNSPYTVDIEVVLGDTDLLSGSGINTTCKGGIGQQFCATSVLHTVVTQRITQSTN